VFDNAGVYSYVYTVPLASTSRVPLHQATVSTFGMDDFSTLLNWGIVTNETTSHPATLVSPASASTRTIWLFSQPVIIRFYPGWDA